MTAPYIVVVALALVLGQPVLPVGMERLPGVDANWLERSRKRLKLYQSKNSYRLDF